MKCKDCFWFDSSTQPMLLPDGTKDVIVNHCHFHMRNTDQNYWCKDYAMVKRVEEDGVLYVEPVYPARPRRIIHEQHPENSVPAA